MIDAVIFPFLMEVYNLSTRIEEEIRKRIERDPEEKILWWDHIWWSGTDFMAKVDECSFNLQKSGIGKGSRLALYAPDSPLVLMLSLAVWKLKASIVPLNPRGGIEANLRVLGKINPSVIVVSDGIRDLPEALDRAGYPTVTAPPEGPVPCFKNCGLAAGNSTTAVIFATSGTTADPKVVPLSHENLLENTRQVHEFQEGFEKGRILMNILPPFHAFGYSVCGLLPLIFGLPQVLLPSFIPVKNCLSAIRETGVETLIAVPAMLPFLLGSVQKGENIPSSLKYVLTGGGRLDPELEKRVEDQLGVIIYQGYGLTECSPVVAANRSNATKKPGTIGQVLPGYEIRITDLEGNPLPEEQEGILWVRGPSVCSGYIDAPDLNRERFLDGWFNTGDIVQIDSEGIIKVLDRATDLIVVGGFNVYPQEIEEVLQEHSEVKMAAVAGFRHHLTGEYPRAFVILEENSRISGSELIQFCKGKLAHYKVPRKIEFVNELPLSPVGKILRRKLKERIS